MSDKFEIFKSQYPNLFKEYPRSGFDLRPGWETLAHTLCSILEHHICELPAELREHAYCAQVKEKFGGLRFYMNQSTSQMEGAIQVAEHLSLHLCEVCGHPGTLRKGGWILTLCDQHSDERKSKK